MAKGFNITSASFDGQPMTFPVSARIALQGQSVDDATGVDAFIQAKRLAFRQCVIQVAFNDHDACQLMQTTKFGGSGTLTIVVPDTAGVGQTATILTALCTEVIQDAQHAQFGSHVATFEAIATDGATNPISWA